MTIHFVYSPMTNGEVLDSVLRQLEIGSFNGQHELSTFSIEMIFGWVLGYLREERDIHLHQEAHKDLSTESLRFSIRHFMAQMKDAGIVTDWEGEVKHHTRDPERLHCVDNVETFSKMLRFSQLVEAQVIRPEVPKLIKTWGPPGTLVGCRSLIAKALTAEGNEFETLVRAVNNYLELYPVCSGPWELPFTPATSKHRVFQSCHQFARAIIAERQGQVEGVVELILRVQLAFVQDRALWWMRAVNKFVNQNKPILKKLKRRKRDIAVKIFFEEARRQEALEKAIVEFNEKTDGALAQFADFGWLNSIFSPWGEPWELKDPIPDIDPMFRVVRE